MKKLKYDEDIFISNSLLLATTSALLWHFYMIVKNGGKFYIQEPDKNILTAEIIGLSLIGMFSLYKVVHSLNKLGKR